MVGGVGLAAANGVGEDGARAASGPGAAQALSATARIAPAASLPLIALPSRPAARPGRVIVGTKSATPFYDRRRFSPAVFGAANMSAA